MYTVYVIYSESHKVKYTGQTEDFERRLYEHNNGLFGAYTKNKAPWILIYSEKFNTRVEAMSREKYLKTGAGRDLIKSVSGY